MKHIIWLGLLFSFLIGCKGEVTKDLSNKSSKRPNIILVMADDLGWGDVGFNGNKTIKTPNMDQMAAQGVVFDRFYTASPVCSPTRASFITGRNPLRMNIPNANSGHMKLEEITLSEILSTQGYVSGHFGKWHLGTFSKSIPDANRGGKEQFIDDYTIPTDHGYDQFFATESKVPTYDPMVKPKIFEEGESLRYGWKKIAGKPNQPYGTAYWAGSQQPVEDKLEGDDSQIIMDRVLPFVKEATAKKRPFFTTVWFHAPHLPVVADSLSRSKYQEFGIEEQLYYGTISAMDKQMGQLWQLLKDLEIEENTMILFCSDNGPENKTPGSAGPYRGRKRSLYEGGIRVPAFMLWKGEFKTGRISAAMTTSDILPTVLDAIDVKYPDKRPLDGISTLPFIQDTLKKREHPYGFIYKNAHSWVSGNYKLISNNKGGTYELYDIVKDVSEENNLYETNPNQAAAMQQQLSKWLSSVEDSKNGKDYSLK